MGFRPAVVLVPRCHRRARARSSVGLTIVFRDGLRYFLSADTITSVNSVAQLTLRIDMPGT